jgi:hypothetical protein
MDKMEEELLKALKDSDAAENDEYRMFCLSLVPKLRRIADFSKKEVGEAQVKIQTLLLEYERE